MATELLTNFAVLPFKSVSERVNMEGKSQDKHTTQRTKVKHLKRLFGHVISPDTESAKAPEGAFS